MKRLIALAIFAALAIAAPAAAADTIAARQHVDAALQQQGRADANTQLLERALLLSMEQQRATVDWYEAREKARDERILRAEGTVGYRVGEWVKRAAWWLTAAVVGAYAIVFGLRALALGPATGGVGAILAIIGTAIGGILPGGGYIQAWGDNTYFRSVKPARDEYRTLKERERLRRAELGER
jgi:hypothetical protein